MFDRYELEMQEWLGSAPEIEPEDLLSELDVVMGKINRESARAAELISQVVETQAFRRDGYPSATALLKHRYSWIGPGATQLVARANGLLHAPAVSNAHQAGALSTSQVDALLQVRATAPETFAVDEERLVETAKGTPLVAELRKTLDYWLREVASDGQESDRAIVRDSRALRVRRDLDMIHVSGWYDIESGEQLLSALEPGPPALDDDRSTPMRRADQLLDIINGASQRPNIIVHVGYGEMLRARTGISETGRGNFMTGDEVDRISCEASINRVVFDSQDRPLEVGRTKRLVTPAQRTAIEARDLGCKFLGCDRPSNWCDVHHIVHWRDGGATDLDNLILLCRHHHTLLHSGWRIEGEPTYPRFYRPDGTLLEPRPEVLPPDPPPISDPRERLARFQAIKDKHRHLGRDGPDD